MERIIRVVALSDDEDAVLIVNTCDYITFKNINIICEAIYQKNQFSGIDISLFNARATTRKKYLAKRILRGEYYHPATNALWFYAPKKGDKYKYIWYGQKLSVRYKSHCFYNPDPCICKEIH